MYPFIECLNYMLILKSCLLFFSSYQDCVIINGMAQCGEACEHYTELNDDGLSEYNINGNSYCKYYSAEGWYRMFVGQTSAQIPETCVQDSRCDGYTHLQMSEPHPTQYNQTVTRSLCYSYGSNCCFYTSHTIKVKLCFGDFYVYKLQTLPGCNIAYCAGNDLSSCSLVFCLYEYYFNINVLLLPRKENNN
uniref:UMOD/GP2/OIT3-like D8C domain-containing protein n=1 Tax=Oryzias melastigma TaxID=30732 RepID=A0A3B3BE06_ORYME